VQPSEFKQHALWSATDGLGVALDNAPQPDGDDLHKVERVRAVHDDLAQRRDVNPYLMDENLLDQVHTGIDAVRTAMAAYVADPEAGAAQLDTAVAQTTQVLTYLRTWPQPPADTATKATKAAASRFHTSVDEMLGALKQRADALAARLEEIDGQGQERTETAKEELAALQTAIEQSQTETTALATRLTEQIETQRTSFEAEAKSRSQSFTAEVEELREAAQTEATAFAERSKEAHADQKAKADEILKVLAEREERAKALLDATSRHAIAGDYGKWAARQARAAMIYTILAVVIGLATAGVLLYSLGGAADDSIQFTLYKTGISVVGLIIAGYCARQAAEHRREERVAKRLSLDLAALEPFLEHVEDPTALRTEIARRVFVPEQPKQQEAPPRFGFGRGLNITELTALLAVLKAPGGPPAP
jgi:chemotaxis protein histidine kinase CheA